MAYKDSLFRSIFGNEKALLALHNAIHHTSYNPDETEIKINTLQDNIWTGQKNDLSYNINKKIIVVKEHQSTINENMPLRCLQHIARLLENELPDKKMIYRQKLIKLPCPYFIVLYNGQQAFPACRTLRLSDAFEAVAETVRGMLELEVYVLNINEGYNEGYNEEIISRSAELKGYVYFVSQARKYEEGERRAGNMINKAVSLKVVRQAIKDCKRAGLLVEFWEQLSMEEILMVSEEWDYNVALEVYREEAFENGIELGVAKGKEMGIEVGRQEGIEKMVRNLLSLGMNVEQVAQAAELDIERVRDLYL